MALSEKMKTALLGVADNNGRASAYRLGASVATMYALSDRKLIKAEGGTGWMFSPKTGAWLLTDAGRVMAAKLKEGA